MTSKHLQKKQEREIEKNIPIGIRTQLNNKLSQIKNNKTNLKIQLIWSSFEQTKFSDFSSDNTIIVAPKACNNSLNYRLLLFNNCQILYIKLPASHLSTSQTKTLSMQEIGFFRNTNTLKVPLWYFFSCKKKKCYKIGRKKTKTLGQFRNKHYLRMTKVTFSFFPLFSYFCLIKIKPFLYENGIKIWFHFVIWVYLQRIHRQSTGNSV